MKIRKGYKKTEIGRIPKEWDVVRLKDAEEMKLIMGQSPPGKSYNRKGEGIPFIQGKAEFGSIYPSPVLWTSQPTKIAEEGDILISVRAPVGEVNICPYRLCIGRGLAAIRIRKGSNMFYFYWFQKEKEHIEIIGKGSTFKAITKEELSNLSIPFPPLPEQRKIAEILSTVDETIEKVDESIKRTERLKKGLMQHLLTKGIGHKEFKDTEIGRIPKEWEVVRLGDPEISEAIYYGITAKACSYKTGLKMLRTTDIKNFVFDYHKLPYCKITDTRNQISQYKLFEGDIIVARAGTVGVSVLVDRDYEDVVFGSYLIKVKPKKEEIYPKYIHYFFQSYMYWSHIKKAQGSTLKNINLPLLKSLILPLPPLSEQKKIAEILSTVDKRLELLKSKKEKLKRIKKGLMNDLLTGKRRVKV